jgi:MFS family permease
MYNRRLLGELARSVYIPGFLMFVGYGMTAPIVPLYATSLGATLTIAGIVIALHGVGPLLVNLPSGIILGRIGNRKVLIASTVGALVSAVAMGASRTIAPLALFYFLAGAFQSTWSITRVAFVRAAVPPELRGRAIAAIGGLVRIGGFVGPVIGGFIAQYLGFSAACYAQAAITALALLFYLLPVTVRDEPRPAVTPRPLAEIATVFRTHYRSFLTVGLVAITFSMVRTARSTIFPLWGDSISIDVARIGIIVGLSSGIDMLLFAPAGMIMDRFGRKWCAVPSLVVMSVSLLFLPLSLTFASLLASGLAIGLGNGLGAGIVMTLGSDLAPEENTGTFLGAWFLVSGIGSTVGPLIIGSIADALTLGTASIVTAVLGFAGAAYLLFFTKETRPT